MMAAASAVTAAQALCLNPLGCEPKTLEDCLTDATTRSTDAGVKLAERQCRERFDRIRAEAVRREAEAFAKRWEGTKSFARIAQFIAALGEPSLVSRGIDCAIKPPSGGKCITYEWVDRRDRTCIRPSLANPGDIVIQCHFRVQALESDSQKGAWAIWDESL